MSYVKQVVSEAFVQLWANFLGADHAWSRLIVHPGEVIWAQMLTFWVLYFLKHKEWLSNFSFATSFTTIAEIDSSLKFAKMGYIWNVRIPVFYYMSGVAYLRDDDDFFPFYLHVMRKRRRRYVCNQWRTHGGGGSGVETPPLMTEKMKTSLFETIRLFSYRDCRNFYQLSCFSVLSNFLNMLHNLEKLSLWCNNTGSQTFLVRYAWCWRLQIKWNQSRSSRPPNPPIGGAHTAKRGPKLSWRTRNCINSKTKFCLANRVEWDFLRSDSIYFSFKIFRYRLLSNSVINCIMMS